MQLSHFTTTSELTAVTWTEKAARQVQDAVIAGRLIPLYSKPDDTPGALAAIAEVIAQDPRYSLVDGNDLHAACWRPRQITHCKHIFHRTLARSAIHNGRGTKTDGSYGVTFSSLRVYFEVGEERVASIVHAELDPGDETAPVGTYQHSLAQRRAAEVCRRQRKHLTQNYRE